MAPRMNEIRSIGDRLMVKIALLGGIHLRKVVFSLLLISLIAPMVFAATTQLPSAKPIVQTHLLAPSQTIDKPPFISGYKAVIGSGSASFDISKGTVSVTAVNKTKIKNTNHATAGFNSNLVQAAANGRLLAAVVIPEFFQNSLSAGVKAYVMLEVYNVSTTPGAADQRIKTDTGRDYGVFDLTNRLMNFATEPLPVTGKYYTRATVVIEADSPLSKGSASGRILEIHLQPTS